MYQDMIDTIGFVQKADPEVGAAMERELDASAPTSSSSPARTSSRRP